MMFKKTQGMVYRVLGTGYGRSGNRIKTRHSSQKDSKKGFTLVELIVVLVIITILAAVAVPVMLGFTDGAKEKKYIAEAKAALTATQTMMSDAYTDSLTYLSKEVRDQAKKTAGAPDGSSFVIWTSASFRNADGTYKTMPSYSIAEAMYKTEDGNYVYFDGSDWTVYAAEVDENGNDLSEGKEISDNKKDNKIYVWPFTMGNDTIGADTAGAENVAKEGDPEEPGIVKPEADDVDKDNKDKTDKETKLDTSTKITVTLFKGNGFSFGDATADKNGIKLTYEVNGESGYWSTSVSDEGATSDGKEYTFGTDAFYDATTLSYSDGSTTYSSLTGSDLEDILVGLAKNNLSTYELTASRNEISKEIPIFFVASSDYLKVNVSDSTSDNKNSVYIRYGLATGDYSIVASDKKDADTVTLSENSVKVASAEGHDARFYNNTAKPSLVDGKWIVRDPENSNDYLEESDEYVEKKINEVGGWVADTYLANITDSNDVDGTISKFDALKETGIAFEARADVHKNIRVEAKEEKDGLVFEKQYTDVTLEFSQIEAPKNESDNAGDVKIVGAKSGDTSIEVNTKVINVDNDSIFNEDGAATLNAEVAGELRSFDDNNSYSVEGEGTHKIKEWEIYDADLSCENKEADPWVTTRKWDCSSDLLPHLYDKNNAFDGEVAIVDADLFSTLFVVDNRNYKEINPNSPYVIPCELNQRLRWLVCDPKYANNYDANNNLATKTANWRINSIKVISKSAVYQNRYNDRVRETYLSETSIVKGSGADQDKLLRTGADDEKGIFGEYVIDEYDKDYPAYIVGYSVDAGGGKYDIYIFNEVDEDQMTAKGNLQNLFRACSNLTQDSDNDLIHHMNTSEVTNAVNLFKFCAMETINVPEFDCSGLVEVRSMLSSSDVLVSASLGSGEYLDTRNATDFIEMCKDSPHITFVGGCGASDDGQETPQGARIRINSAKDMTSAFNNCTDLEKVKLIGGGKNAEDHTDLVIKDIFTKTSLKDLEISNVLFEGYSNNDNGSGECGLWDYFKNNKSTLEEVTLTSISIPNVGNLDNLFNGYSKLKKATFTDIDAPYLKRMKQTFINCKILESVTFDHFNAPNVWNFSWVFDGCTNLTEVNLGSYGVEGSMTFETKTTANKGAKDFGGTFRNCSSLTTLDLSAFNIQQNVKTNDMFNGCTALQTIYATDPCDHDGYGFGKEYIKDNANMFNNCKVLVGSNGTSFAEKKKTDYTYAEVDNSNHAGYFSEKPTDMAVSINGQFKTLISNNKSTVVAIERSENLPEGITVDRSKDASDTNHIEFINLDSKRTNEEGEEVEEKGNFYAWYEGDKIKWWSDATTIYFPADISNLFNGCSNLLTIDLSCFDTNDVKNVNTMFKGCSNVTSITITEGFKLNNVSALNYNWTSMFDGLIKLENFNGSQYLEFAKASGNGSGSFGNLFINVGSSAVNKNLILDLSGIQGLNVTNATKMFFNCGAKEIRLPNYDTTSLTNARQLFAGCSNLEVVELGSKFTLENATETASDGGNGGLFSNDINLHQIIGSEYLKLSNTTSVLAMFENAGKNYTGDWTLDLSSLECSKAKSSKAMFNYCGAKKIIMPNFDTESITDTQKMFSNCPNLEEIELGSKFKLNNATTIFEGSTFTGMFKNDKKLHVIKGSQYIELEKGPNLRCMFENVGAETDGDWTLDLSGLKGSDANSFGMDAMFKNSKIKEIKLNSLNTTKLSSMNECFMGCSGLQTIYVGSDWNIDNVSKNNAFKDCSAEIVVAD